MRSRLLPLVLVVLAGCGGGAAPARSAGPPVRPLTVPSGATRCDDVAASVLGQIAQRIYRQAGHGYNVRAARRRLGRSRGLARAVAAGDRVRTRAKLMPLLRHQIRRIVVTGRGGAVLADVGRVEALAPVHGVVREGGRVVGRYVMAVDDDHAVAGIMHSLTGAQVTMRAGRRTVVRVRGRGAGAAARAVVLRGTAFPIGALAMRLRLPAATMATCGATPGETLADTVGAVGERLYRNEAHGQAVDRVMAKLNHDAAFRRAVVTDDPALLRREIVRMFRDRTLHVVRIRAVDARGRLVGDVGGPDVIAPATRPLRGPGRKVLGRVTLSVQDDTGYVKLMHRFTGAAVELRTATGLVAGSTLSPGPAAIPARGAVVYRGRSYQAFSFPGRAFPNAPMTIALLVPVAGPPLSSSPTGP